METIYDLVAKNIKYYRKLLGYTQKELADMTGYSHSYIRRIEAENIHNRFPMEVVESVAKALDIKTWIFYYERKEGLNYEFVRYIDLLDRLK